MTKTALVMLSLLSLATPACVVTTTNRDVGSVAADGSVFLGWHLIARDNKSSVDDQETYDIGNQFGAFSTLRLHVDRPTTITQVLVIFADGERWVAQAPAALAQNEWSAPIPLPRGPRPIHSVIVTGRSSSSMLAKLEIYGTR